MIEVKNLNKRFGALAAVQDISFHVGRGEVLGFLGPNGAGKSTTMRMITGYLAPDSGIVRIAGEDIAVDAINARKRIGYLPEGVPLYGDMSPRRFLEFVAEVRGYSGEEQQARIANVVDKMELRSVLDRRIETLSKGFKRRVGLAQAILHDPEILILDEPTDGLDPNQKHEVRNLIRGISQEKAIILSTHILEEVDAVCTRTIIIAEGRVVADGSPNELAARSRAHNAVSVAVREGAANAVLEVLDALSGVESVEVLEETSDLSRFRVYSGTGSSLVAPISRAAREHGWEIEELHVERGKLDEVFRSVTTKQALGEGSA